MSYERLPSDYVSDFRKTHGRSISLAEGPIDETVVSHLAGHKDARLHQFLDFLPVRDRVALSRVGPELRSKVIKYEEAFRRTEMSTKFEMSFGMSLHGALDDKYEFMHEEIRFVFPFPSTNGPQSEDNLRYDVSNMVHSIKFHEFMYSLLDSVNVHFSPHKRIEVDRLRKMTRNEKKLMISTMEYAPLDGKIILSTRKTQKYPKLGSIVGLQNILKYKNYTFDFTIGYANTQYTHFH